MRDSLCHQESRYAVGRSRLCDGGVCIAVGVDRAQARVQTFGPFIVDDARPSVITLNGTIDHRAALQFRNARRAAPDATILELNSDGGDVSAGLLIADEFTTTGIDANSRRLGLLLGKSVLQDRKESCAFCLTGLPRFRHAILIDYGA